MPPAQGFSRSVMGKGGEEGPRLSAAWISLCARLGSLETDSEVEVSTLAVSWEAFQEQHR